MEMETETEKEIEECYSVTREPFTTSYGMDVGYDGGLPGLLKTIDGVAREFGGGWMRLMYAYPSKFDDASIDAIGRLDNIVKYIDMPLQHASDAMLKAMRRHTTRAHTEELLAKLRERVPGIAIRTTFIVGFPGETDDDFDPARYQEYARDPRTQKWDALMRTFQKPAPSARAGEWKRAHAPQKLLQWVARYHAWERA